VLEEFGVGSQRLFGKDVDEETLDTWAPACEDHMYGALRCGASGVLCWGWGVPKARDVPVWRKREDHDTTDGQLCSLIGHR
jgi:hypothetical protein